MISNIYAVYDTKADAFLSPFFTHNNALAIRSFSDSANDPSTNLHRHPLDFALYHLGDFDDHKGLITPLDPPVQLGFAKDYINSGD